MRKFSFLKFNFLITTLTTCLIILTNVVINFLFNVSFETAFDGSKLLVESIHEVIFTAKLNCTTGIANLLSRRCNRRLGRSLDLCFSYTVERFNGGGNKIITIFSFHEIPHSADRSVHGLGGALGLALGDGRRPGFLSRLGELVAEITGNRRDSVQDGCDICVWGLEQHGIQLVAHLSHCCGEGTEYGGED
ncbi:ATP-dependent protease ATP-binding subunit, putative [Babesia ovata]|uniref:ATP-dependent protease ATP-binding subunit, putative n=1 Tax=Babesia ovata TaxID=189622 RepID=A0A2H6KC45_9APIC|nr:ATP-dependent protease ATP-binding subunit, putative [Babesia ovata]GBE60566.1 ATP-dependent protease ATP-binding subunit, putative [Babesia ovata]